MSQIERIDDGKDNMIFGFDINGKKVTACTVHEEFLEASGVPLENREQVAQGIAQMFIGMLKPFMELAK